MPYSPRRTHGTEEYGIINAMKTIKARLVALCAVSLFCALADAAPLVQAHRGGRGEYDDNAKGGFVRSLERGIRGFETDVRFTKDHKLVIMHDSSVSRTTDGKGTVEEMTLAEIRKCRINNCSEPVPTAEEVMSTLRGRKDTFIELEMKAYPTNPFYTPKVLEAYCRALNAAARRILEPGTYAFTCFNTNTLIMMRKVDPKAKLGYIMGGGLTDEHLKTARSIGCVSVAPSLRKTSKEMVDRAHAMGMTVCLWMAQNAADYAEAEAKGADRVTSDYPMLLQDRVRGKRKKLVCMDLDATLCQHRSPIPAENFKALKALEAKYKCIMVGAGNAPRIYRQMGNYPIDIVANYGMQESTVTNGEFRIVRAVTNTVDRKFFREKTDYLRQKYGYTEYEGEPLEFHASGMVTFGLLGTKPAAEHKVAFDPDRKKRRAMYKEVCEIFKDFSVYIGGSTSFDFAGPQYNKYDATLSWALRHGYTLEDIVFIGDDFADGGGDSHVRIKGMDHLVVTDFRKFPQVVSVLLKDETDAAACKASAAPAGLDGKKIAARFPVISQDKMQWHLRTKFTMDGCEAWVVEPDVPAPDGRWAWCMEWPTAFQDRVGVRALLAAGYRWVTFNPASKTVYSGNQNDEMIAKRRAFQKFLVEELGYAKKCCLIGMSWGGYYSVRYASTHPDCVAAAYLDAPLLDFTTSSMYTAPSSASATKEKLRQYYPFITDSYVGADDPFQSVNRAEPIAKAGIPLLILYGGVDTVVPPEKNCLRFAEAFEKAGGDLMMERRGRYGHHPHGVEPNEVQRIVNFFNRAYDKEAKRAAAAAADPAGALSLIVPKPVKVQAREGFAGEEALRRVEVTCGKVPGAPADVADEAYVMEVLPNFIKVTVATPKGERYARVTLAQLVKLTGGKLPCCTITDWPAMRWRGYMNDCGRNYLALDGVKAILDMMGKYKLNLFHWHLADYHGWRLESKKYPQLNRKEAFLRQIGKFYTQKEFREIVRYAAERGITVMPELDVPGHTLAFRRGMGIDSMAAPGTDKVISDLFEELCSLTSPEEMPFVHIGTDEVRVKAEFCDESWPTLWARTLNRAGRKAVVWAPGKPIDPSCDVVDMAWYDNHVTNTVNQAFDAARMYNASWTPFEVLAYAAFRKPCRWNIAGGRKLGAITCTWHDDNVGDDTLKLFKECMVFPSIVAMGDNFWSGRAADEPGCIVRMPKPGTPQFALVEDLERRMLAQRDLALADFPHPFQVVAQTAMRWRVTECATGKVLLDDAPQGTLRLTLRYNKDGGIAAHVKGRVAAETWIWAPSDIACGAWIDLAAINGVYGRLVMPHTPARGEWNAFGGKVELNGAELPPPEWKQPGMTSTTKAIREQDVPYSTDLLEKPLVDEMPGLRDPYPIRLKKGWNHVKISTEVKDGDRCITFVPMLGTTTRPREVPGLKYRSSPPQK